MIQLNTLSTRPPEHLDKDSIRAATDQLVKRLGALQEVLYAQKKHAVLVVFQGMDASGKDGAADKVFEDCHPAGLRIFSFKKPTPQELAHDFLWRIHQHVPEKGMIHIFNRSHYEDVVIQRVHQWIDEDRVAKRLAAINAFEELLLFDNNTLILKFFFHISREQQEIELQERLTDPTKHWKHSDNDWKEREYWDDYQRCYADAINGSTLPWIVVPVDRRWYRDYVMAQALVQALEKLDLQYPPLNREA